MLLLKIEWSGIISFHEVDRISVGLIDMAETFSPNNLHIVSSHLLKLF